MANPCSFVFPALWAFGVSDSQPSSHAAASGQAVGACGRGLPHVAYVALWFPLSSETFVFREVEALRSLGLPVHAYAMYGKARKGLSREMAAYGGPVERMGLRAFLPILAAFSRWLKRKPGAVWGLARRGLFRRMRNLEAQGENFWCFMAGFLLASQCERDGIGLIQSAWANGPATAAWVASHLTGIPFGFTGRAGDIYPQDGILAEKAKDALFIRVNNAANISWLARFCPGAQSGKIKLVYNGLTFAKAPEGGRVRPRSPYHVLAVGRFARTKGFPELLTAMARLKRERFPVKLTLVGDGRWRRRLLRQRRRLGLEDCVEMPGFLPNDQIARYMQSHDLLVVPSVVYENGDRDGIPNVIMEACSAGLPVVATDVCGISEVIRGGETGALVRQRDPAALAAAIRTMLENPENAEAMAARAKNVVRGMFDTRKNSEALLKLYCDALEVARA